MCSIADEEIDGDLIKADDEVSINDKTLCVKCRSPSVVLLRVRDVFCKPCFLHYVSHKLRSALGKSKIMLPTDKVLVGFSGSPSSMALLHMLSQGKKKPDPKKLIYEVLICYIDDGLVFGKSVEERMKTAERYKNIVESQGFHFHLTSLSLSSFDSYTMQPSEVLHIDDANLLSLMKSVGSLTSKEELYRKLKLNRLVDVAKELGCTKIFTAENQNSLAVKLFTCVAQGRGEQIGAEVGFSDFRHEGLTILRPMKRIDSVEINYYNDFCDLPIENPNSSSLIEANGSSIQKITSEFLNGLAGDFKYTTSTISRTGDKLEVETTQIEKEDTCLLCRGKISNHKTDAAYSAVQATAFSRIVSRPSSSRSKETSSENCCGECSCSKKGEVTEEQLQLCFCYGCLIILRDLKSVDLLPSSISDEISKRISLTSMRKEIEDFLL